MNPHDLQAERSVIGSMLIRNSTIQACRNILKAEDFYHEANREAFRAILSVTDKHPNSDADETTVSSALLEMGASHADKKYLLACNDETAVASNAEHYAKTVLGKSLERQIIASCIHLRDEATEDNIRKISELVRSRDCLGAPPMLQYKDLTIDIIDEIAARKGRELFRMGIDALDKITGGFARGELLTVAGGTNIGKSLLLLGMMHHLAGRANDCLFVGSEMSAKETVMRHLTVESGVEPWRIRKGDLQMSHIINLKDSMMRVCKLPITILDLPHPGLSDIEAAIVSSGCDVAFLDYLTRFRLTDVDKNLRLRIKHFLTELKTMARRRNILIVLAAQLNRSVYGKEDNTPTLADLSESSSIEQESDAVLLLHAPKDRQPDPTTMQKVIVAKIAKNRNGVVGAVVDLNLDGRTLKLTEIKGKVKK